MTSLTLLGATVRGDANLTASANFPREGEDDRRGIVRVMAEDAARSDEKIGHR